MSESKKLLCTLPFEITADSIINSTLAENTHLLQDVSLEITIEDRMGIEFARGDEKSTEYLSIENPSFIQETPSNLSSILLNLEQQSARMNFFDVARTVVNFEEREELSLGIEDMSIPALNFSNVESEAAARPNACQKQEKDSFSIAEIITSKEKLSQPDSTEGDFSESVADRKEMDIGDEVEQSLLNMSAINYSQIEPQLSEFKNAIFKRDDIIKKLVDSYRVMEKQLAEKKEELKKVGSMAGEMESLQKFMKEMVENSEQYKHQSMLSGLEMSSYLNPPEEGLRSEGDGVESRTFSQECQTDAIVTPGKFTIEMSSQTQSSRPILTPETIKTNCMELKTSTQSIRQELLNLTDFVKMTLKPPDEIKALANIQQMLHQIQSKHDDELSVLREEHTCELEDHNNILIQLQRDLQESNVTSTRVINEKVTENQVLKAKIAELEEAKKSSDLRLTSFSSRLSPEGSELDDLSLNDSQSISVPGSLPNNFPTTRPKMEYLTLTPPLETDDDNVGTEEYGRLSNPRSSVIEDLNLQVSDLSRKLESNGKYLNEQAAERELERDEFSRRVMDFENRIEDLTKEKCHFEKVIDNQKLEIDDFEVRLKEATESEQDLLSKADKVEDELKLAVDKIYELREIIRELEDQIDSATHNAGELKEQNEFLTDEVERLETERKQHEQDLNTTQDTVVTLVSDVSEELHVQVQDLTVRLVKKLNELDNFPWCTRPNSSCSGALSVSTEEISVRELSYMNRDKDIGSTPLQLAEGLRQLEIHFDSLVRFEEVVMKKLKDAELRLSHAKKREEELENEKPAYLEAMKAQTIKISDLESRLDQFRFQPSPNTVTLSGLRSRVTTLSEDLEEYKGQIQLKNIEMKELMNKLEASQDLLAMYTSSPKRVTPTVRKSSSTTQTDKLGGVRNCNSYTQTELERVSLKQINDVCVQTSMTSTKTKSSQKDWNYASVGLDTLELSTIHGGPAPTHSTPNEGVEVRKTSRPNIFESVSWPDKMALTKKIEQGSPEVLREPCHTNVPSSFQLDQLYRRKDTRIVPVPSSAEQIESEEEHDGFLDVVEIGSDEVISEPKPRFAMRSLLRASIPAIVHEEMDIQLRARSPSSVAEETARNKIISDFDEDLGLPPPSVSDYAISEKAMAELPSGTSIPHTKSMSMVSSGSISRYKNTSSVKVKKVAKEVQTPPLAISSLIDALDDEERANLFEAMDRIRNQENPQEPDEKDTEIKKLMKRIHELEEMPGGPCPESCNNIATCRIETVLDFDQSMRPKSAETHMNYVVTPVECDKDAENDSSDMEYLEKLSALTTALENDERKLANLTPLEANILLQALKERTNRTAKNDPQVPCVSPKSYEYNIDTVVDFAEGDNGDLSLVDDKDERIIPSASKATIALKDEKGEKRVNSKPKTNWDEMENKRASRLQDIDDQIMAETAKTQLDQLQLALDNERKKTAHLQEQVDNLRKKLDEEPGNEQVPPEELEETIKELETQIGYLQLAYNNMQQLYSEEKGKVDEMLPELQQLAQEYENEQLKINDLENELNDRMSNEESLVNQLNEVVASLENQQKLKSDLMVQNQALRNDILQLQSQVHHLHNAAMGGPPGRPATQPGPQVGSKTLELYLRAKSFRKALTWQKKYLLIVIIEYKELLKDYGGRITHPDLLQKEIPLTPASIGLANPQSMIVRFRIIGRVVIATIRMNWMVLRWKNKLGGGSGGTSSTMSSKENSPPLLLVGGSSSDSLSPPTRDEGFKRRFPTHTHPFRRCDNDKIKDDIFIRPKNVAPRSKKYTTPTPEILKDSSILSQYIERFQYLEGEIGRTLKKSK